MRRPGTCSTVRCGSASASKFTSSQQEARGPVFAERVLSAGELGLPVNAALGLEGVPFASFALDEHGLGSLGEPCGHADAAYGATSQIMGLGRSGILALIFRVTVRRDLVSTKMTCGDSRRWRA